MALLALAIGFEVMPARVMAEVLAPYGDVELISVVALAGFGALVGLFIGELLRRCRRRRPGASMDRFVLVLVIAGALAFHVFLFAVNLAYAAASVVHHTTARFPDATQRAGLLTALAVAGTMLALIVGYRRVS